MRLILICFEQVLAFSLALNNPTKYMIAVGLLLSQEPVRRFTASGCGLGGLGGRGPLNSAETRSRRSGNVPHSTLRCSLRSLKTFSPPDPRGLWLGWCYPFPPSHPGDVQLTFSNPPRRHLIGPWRPPIALWSSHRFHNHLLLSTRYPYCASIHVLRNF